MKSRFETLTAQVHDRDVVGLTYVYPVVSRRARGVSLGINLNPNNACNWRCVYCQVEGLTRGAAPPIDLVRLETELITLVDAIEQDGFLERHVPENQRRLTDLALSGNGEPTLSAQFGEVLELLCRVQKARPIIAELPVVLITNGSLADRPSVQSALRRLSGMNGVVWFKLDAGSDEGLRATNSCSTRLARHLERLTIVAQLCPTYVQSCWFRRGGQDPSPKDVDDYLAALRTLGQRKVGIRGVQLYTLARKSQQTEALALSAVDAAWLSDLACAIGEMGFSVQVAQ